MNMSKCDCNVKQPVKKVKKEKTPKVKQEPATVASPTKKRVKKEEEQEEVWKW